MTRAGRVFLPGRLAAAAGTRVRRRDLAMTTVVACPQCRQELKLPEELVGRAVQCPECKHTFTAAVTPAATPAAPGAPPPLPPQTAVSEAPLVDVETDEEEFEKPI